MSENLHSFMQSQQTILSRNDFSILTAKTAEEMLIIHGREGADLILAELDIPEMGGDGLCAAIRNTYGLRSVSVILVYPDTPDAFARATQCGANATIPKTVNADHLSRRIQGLLEIKARESLRVLMKVSVEGKREDDYFFSHSQNISASGILLETDIALSVGNRITCSFFLKGRQMTIHGTVMRVIVINKNLYQYGVKFVDINRSEQDIIEDFVQNRRAIGSP